MKEHRHEKNLKHRDGSMGRGWYYDFKMTINGRQERFRGFGGYSKEAARNELVRLRMEKLDEKRGVRKSYENIRFEDFAKEFLEKYSEVNKRSAERDGFSIEHLSSFFKNKLLSEISPYLVESYKAQRKAEKIMKGGELVPVSPSTINRELACLKTILNKAVEWGKLESNPIVRVKKFPEPQSKDRILSSEEARRLLDTAKPHLRPILIVLLNTGMRKNEALGLRWENVDFRKGFIYVGAKDSKSGKSRTIPMSSDILFETLESLRAGAKSEFVFTNPETGTKYSDITTSFKTACDEAEIEGVTLHALRHTAGWRMVEAGADLVTVMKILGHSSIQMTIRYCHPNPENFRLAIKKLGDFITRQGQKEDTVILPKPVTDVKNYL